MARLNQSSYMHKLVATYNVMGSRLIFMDFFFPLASADQNKAASSSTTSGALNLGHDQLQQSNSGLHK